MAATRGLGFALVGFALLATSCTQAPEVEVVLAPTPEATPTPAPTPTPESTPTPAEPTPTPRFGGGSGDEPVVGTYGSNPVLDLLHDECSGGDLVACDNLYDQSPQGSEYELFGGSCGDPDVGIIDTYCAAGTETSGTGSYGSDPELDALYDECSGGDMAACDSLFIESPLGSEYEDFGGSCGGIFTEISPDPCADLEASETDVDPGQGETPADVTEADWIDGYTTAQKSEYLEGCQDGTNNEFCLCTWDEIATTIPFADFLDYLDQQGDLPDALIDIVARCLARA